MTRIEICRKNGYVYMITLNGHASDGATCGVLSGITDLLEWQLRNIGIVKITVQEFSKTGVKDIFCAPLDAPAVECFMEPAAGLLRQLSLDKR